MSIVELSKKREEIELNSRNTLFPPSPNNLIKENETLFNLPNSQSDYWVGICNKGIFDEAYKNSFVR